MAATVLNASSSRSHCVFTIRVRCACFVTCAPILPQLVRARQKDVRLGTECPVQMTQVRSMHCGRSR